MARPRRPAPQDLEAQHARLKAVCALAKHYRTSHRKAREWVIDAGLPILLPCQHVPAVMPSDFASTAKRRSMTHLRNDLKRGHKLLAVWYAESGVARPNRGPRKAEPKQEDATVAILRYLRAYVGPAFDNGAHYEVVTGKRFIVGRRMMSTTELVQFASNYGWRA